MAASGQTGSESVVQDLGQISLEVYEAQKQAAPSPKDSATAARVTRQSFLDTAAAQVLEHVPALSSSTGTVAKPKSAQAQKDAAAAAQVERQSFLDTLPAPELCQIQFCSPLFFSTEESGCCVVDVMRIGDLGKDAAVYWETRDGSAKAGKKYKAAAGVLEFAQDTRYGQITVHLIDDDGWDPTLDFFVVLKEEGLKNATVHRSYLTCRVKIIDDDFFPSNKFKEEILSDKLHDVSSMALMIEYIKMNWRNAAVRRGSWKCFSTDFLLNVIYIMEVGLRIYLIDYVFQPVLKGGESFGAEGFLKLLVISLFFLIPDLLMHILAYRRNFWKVAGASRKCLQSNLIRKYMSYDDSARKRVDIGQVILVTFVEVAELVAEGYGSIFPLVKNFVQLFIILIFLLLSPVVLGKKVQLKFMIMYLSLFAGFPVVLLTCLHLRRAKSARLMKSMKAEKTVSTSYTISMLNNFWLLADYSKRGHAADQFDAKINSFNGNGAQYNAAMTNNKFVPVALSVVVEAAWMFGGGLLLCTSTNELTLGAFLANLGIFKQIGACWGTIYKNVLDMQECGAGLKTITELMNLPSDNHDQFSYIRQCDKMCRELTQTIGGHDTGKVPAVDRLPIRFSNLSHAYGNRQVFSEVSFDMLQGKLHVVRGARGCGTTTLLQLAGRRTLPLNSESDSSGHLFVPLHLKVIHVSKEPLFIFGTLYENLAYGVPQGNKDGRLGRVVAICRQLGLPDKVLEMISDDKDAAKDNWNEVLSMSSRLLLNIARGLICNPEMLVIHKPSAGLGPRTRPVMFKALRKFVEDRGIELDIDRYHFRRPRTCIISAVSEEDFEYGHDVHKPFDTVWL